MNRAEIEEKVTKGILAQLEKGVVPWSQPWTSAGLLPTSVATKRPYRGINALILWVEAQEKGYASPFWLTFKQTKQLGGSVKKGESATPVVFWKMLEKQERVDGVDVTKRIPLMRYFNVFNLEQTEGVELSNAHLAMVEQGEPVEVDAAVERVLEGYVDGPELKHVKQGRAFYVPSDDAITMPALDQFKSSEGYASTLFHELTHSTGHASRLDRFEGNETFGCESYAKEELVAEIGASILAGAVGVDLDVEQTAAYVGSWLKKLNDDRSLIVSAAQQAQKAVDRILGTTFERKEDN